MTHLRTDPEYEALWEDLPRPMFVALKDSIRFDGLLEKIVVNPELVILDGHHRYRALEELSIEVTEEHYEIQDHKDRAGEILYIIRTQLNRRHATPYHRVENAIPLYRKYQDQARGRRAARWIDVANLPHQDWGKSREKIAELTGISARTVQKAIYIVEHGDAVPGLKERLRRGLKPSIDNAYRQVRETVEPKPTPILPEGQYNVIYADPPWSYSFRLRGAPDDHYPTMKTEEICELKVPVADDAVLFLWATNPLLEDALDVIEAWGFTYKTNRVWVKDHWGTGYYFRGQHELLLLATRGKMSPPPMASRISSVLESPRREHSQKPEEIYTMIEAMYPGHDYLELFAREKRDEWTSWGLEA